MMIKYCDLAICDSVNIEKYIHECYDGKGIKGKNPNTTFIAYGADLTPSKLADDDARLLNWYNKKQLVKKEYYLVVGRFVPENSFEIMIREFMHSKSKKDFAIITNVNDKFLDELTLHSPIYLVSSFTTSSKSVILLLPLTCHSPVNPGLNDILALWCGSYFSHSSSVGGLVPKYVK